MQVPQEVREAQEVPVEVQEVPVEAQEAPVEVEGPESWALTRTSSTNEAHQGPVNLEKRKDDERREKESEKEKEK